MCFESCPNVRESSKSEYNRSREENYSLARARTTPRVVRSDRSSAIFPTVSTETELFHKAAAIQLCRGARMCITNFQNGAKIRNENAKR